MSNDNLQDHYAAGLEESRLQHGHFNIELVRTQELLLRYLPPSPASILDVGGGPGVYSEWLAQLGYDVHLIDIVPLHVEQAAARAAQHPFTVELGDALALRQPEASFDAVLLLGPLYHLTDRGDRVRALAEAARVVRLGGRVIAAAIGRFASLFDGLAGGFLDDPEFAPIVARDLREGQHRNPTERAEWFTTAYLHHAHELQPEFEDAGLAFEAVLGIEGPGQLLQQLLDQPERGEQVLRVARLIEDEPTLLGLSGHLLAVGRRTT